MLKEFLPVERVRRKIDNHHFLSATHQGGWRASMKHDYGKPRSAAAKPVRVHGVDTGAADFVRRKRTAVIKRVLYLTIFLVVLVGGLGYFQPPSTEIRGWASCAIVMGPLAILAATRDGCCERPPPPIAMWTEGCEQKQKYSPIPGFHNTAIEAPPAVSPGSFRTDFQARTPAT